MEHEIDGDTNCNWCVRYNYQRLVSRTIGFGNMNTSSDNPNYSIFNVCQNTEKSPGDLRRLAVTRTPVINHLLILV